MKDIWKNYKVILLILAIFLITFTYSQEDRGLISLQKAYNNIAKKAMPAVVTVYIVPKGFNFNNFPFKIPERYKRQFSKRNKKPLPVGTGFIISKDGYLLSNYHVVSQAKKVYVMFRDSDQLVDVTIVGKDKDTDIALLKLKEKGNYPFLKFANSSKVRVGDIAVAIGNPFGLSHTLTTGVISAIGRTGIGNKYEDFIQTDVAINQGNSGGPLLDIYGNVIGINSMILSRSGENNGIGFAISSDMAKKVFLDLKKDGKVVRGWVGIEISEITSGTLKAIGLPYGVQVVKTVPNSPADKAGIKAGDIIVEIDGRKIKKPNNIISYVGRISVGDKIEVTYWRDGKKQTTTISVMARTKVISTGGLSATDGILGINVGKNKAHPKVGGVVIVNIEEDSILNEYKIKKGDIIAGIYMKNEYYPIEGIEDYKSYIEKMEDQVVLKIIRISKEKNFFSQESFLVEVFLNEE